VLSTKLEKLLTNCLAVILLLSCLSKFGATLAHTLQCTDTAWLIATGQYILAHGLPATDPFSFTCSDRPIVIYQWLFTVALGRLYQFGGLWLVALATALVVSLIYLWHLPTSLLKQGVKPVYVFGLLSLVCSPAFFWARPQLVSFVLIPVFTYLLERFRQRGYDKRLWLLPLLMVIWVNGHSFWFIGLAMVTVYLVTAIAQKSAPERQTLSLLLFTCFVAVLINPYGAGLVAYNLSFTTEPDFGSIRELQPVMMIFPQFYLNHLLYLTLGWLAILIGLRSVPISGLILAAGGTCAALMFYRFIPVAVLLTWPYIGLALSKNHFFNTTEAERADGENYDCKFSQLLTKVLPLLAIASTMFFFLRQFPVGQPVWFTNSDTNFETTKFLKQYPDLTKNLFCDPSIGSALIFENLAPVFIDSRFDFYGRQFCTEFNNCFNAEDGWQQYLEKWQVSSLCVDDTYPIYWALMSSQDWLLAFDDQHFSIWLPNNETGTKRLNKLIADMGGRKLRNLSEERRKEMPERLCQKHALTAVSYLSKGKTQQGLQEIESGLSWSNHAKLTPFLQRNYRRLKSQSTPQAESQSQP